MEGIALMCLALSAILVLLIVLSTYLSLSIHVAHICKWHPKVRAILEDLTLVVLLPIGIASFCYDYYYLGFTATTITSIRHLTWTIIGKSYLMFVSFYLILLGIRTIVYKLDHSEDKNIVTCKKSKNAASTKGR